MEYKQCKHEQERSCRECPCNAWCNKILTCTCGCHDVPTYSYSDYMNAQFVAKEADTSFKLVATEQRKEREQIEQRLMQLNAAEKPFLDKAVSTSKKLDDLKRRLLGPWEDDLRYGGSSHIGILNANREDRFGRSEVVWYHNRVWLRVAGFAGNAWALRVQEVGSAGNKEWIFAKRDRSISLAEDLEINKRLSEPYIIKMGYILPQK